VCFDGATGHWFNARLVANMDSNTWHDLVTNPPNFSKCLCIIMPANFGIVCKHVFFGLGVSL